MKNNQPVTQKNIPMKDASRIISTTNLGGQITYANDDFVAISGFSADELEMKPHNVIRHPDMPQDAYKMLWDTIKKGGTWMGIVKNRCKNGDHYWADALVTPVIEAGQTIGFQSVRTKPSPQEIENASKLYEKIKQGKTNLTTGIGLQAKLSGAALLIVLSTVLPLLMFGMSTGSLAFAAGLGVTIGMITSYVIASPWQQAAEDSRSIIDDPVALRTYTGRTDELGQLQLANHMLQAKLKSVIWRLNDATSQLETLATTTKTNAVVTTEEMSKQNSEIQQVATAITEMVATVSEIASNTAAASEATQAAREYADQSQAVIALGVNTTAALSNQVKNAAEVIEGLKTVAEGIGGVVGVIRSIAEQTNLLALNAAIEAARAGEQGRGFAVVADEVRSLANKTQTSTDEIQGMIETLQSTVENAVNAMESSETIADTNTAQSHEMEQSFSNIISTIGNLTNMVMQIATAAEEQGAVAEEINRNICNINDLSENTVSSTQDSCTSIDELAVQISQLKTVVNQFIKP